MAVDINAYESVVVGDTAVGITTSLINPTGQRKNDACWISIEAGPIRFRLDGTNRTSTEGHLVDPGETIDVDGHDNLVRFRAIRTSAYLTKTFFHGHSYTGNPLACAAALACLDLFGKERVLERLQSKIYFLEARLQEIALQSHVGDVRNTGLMAGIELVRDKETKRPYDWEEKMGWKAASHARAHGVFIRPLGNVVVIMPPLSISEENLARLMHVIAESIHDVTAA